MLQASARNAFAVLRQQRLKNSIDDGRGSAGWPVRLFVYVGPVVVEQLGGGGQRGRMAAAGGRVAVVHRSATDAERRYRRQRRQRIRGESNE